MADKTKVLIYEKNGVELEFQEEIDLSAENVEFDNTTTQYPNDPETVQEAFENISISNLTEFESFSSPANQTTTSNGWVTKTGYPYTTTDKTAGKYVVDFTAQIGQTDKEKQAGSRFQWRPGTAGTWITLGDPVLDALSTDNAYQYRTTFTEIDLVSDGDFQVRIQFGQTDDGGTASIKEANIKIGKVL